MAGRLSIKSAAIAADCVDTLTRTFIMWKAGPVSTDHPQQLFRVEPKSVDKL